MPKPTASYPGSIAGDLKLAIGVNRFQTTLALAIGATDTQMYVANAANIAPFMLLSLDVDGEIVQVIGPASGNQVPISRGFDGTNPVMHLAGATVSGLVDAYHHNTLVAEIEAIETALGANLVNVSPQAAFLISSQFIFPAQSPGGTLTAGAQVITLSPVPKGVNGSDQNHYLYISGGTGAAEAVLIVGGTAVSGAASGTVIVNVGPGGHSGAWTIQSATAGIQEAAVTAGTGGLIFVPGGQWSIFATITLPANVGLLGGGPMASSLNQSTPNVPIVAVGAVYGVQLQGLTLHGNASTTSGYLMTANGSFRLYVNNCYFTNGYSGIDLQGVYWFSLLNSMLANQTNGLLMCDGTANSGEIHISNSLFMGGSPQPLWGLNFQSMNGLYMDGCDVYQTGYGMLIDPGAGQHVGDIFVVNTSFDSCTSSGVRVGPTTADAFVTRLMFTNSWSATNHDGFTLDQTTGTIRGVQWAGGRIFNNHQGGISIVSAQEVLISNVIIGANSSDSAGTYAGIGISGSASQVQISGCRIGQPMDYWSGSPSTNPQSAGILIYAGDYLQIHDNRLMGDTYTISNSSSGTHNLIYANSGYNPVGPAAITVGASPFTYTAGASPETVYISGGTVSSISRAGTVVATASPAQIRLPANGAVTVTYSAAPTMVKDIQ